jgi:hypothetical protein
VLLFLSGFCSSRIGVIVIFSWSCSSSRIGVVYFSLAFIFCVGVIVLLVWSCCFYCVCVVVLVTFLMLLFSHFATIFFMLVLLFFSHGLATFPMLCCYSFCFVLLFFSHGVSSCIGAQVPFGPTIGCCYSCVGGVLICLMLVWYFPPSTLCSLELGALN